MKNINLKSRIQSIRIKRNISLYFTALAFLFILSCSKQNENAQNVTGTSKAVAEQNGAIVRFPAGSPSLSQIKSQDVKLGRSLVSVKAPSRVVATISRAVSSSDKIILFDSPDITTLYSQYRQTKANINLYTQNLKRIKEMFENHASTGKDVNQAENDLNLAHTSLSELEGRMRSGGFNPVELEHAGASSVWLISDVPESQLHEVQSGEAVDVVCNAFPDQTLIAHVSSIGDLIDPTTRTIKVRISMNNYKGKLIPGMFATVDFGDPQDGVVSLPPTSVVSVDGKDYVFIETNAGEYSRREVSVNRSNADSVIITHGLANGEKVVISGAMLLKGISFGY